MAVPFERVRNPCLRPALVNEDHTGAAKPIEADKWKVAFVADEGVHRFYGEKVPVEAISVVSKILLSHDKRKLKNI